LAQVGDHPANAAAAPDGRVSQVMLWSCCGTARPSIDPNAPQISTIPGPDATHVAMILSRSQKVLSGEVLSGTREA